VKKAEGKRTPLLASLGDFNRPLRVRPVRCGKADEINIANWKQALVVIKRVKRQIDYNMLDKNFI
jgi:hypothetical protein